MYKQHIDKELYRHNWEIIEIGQSHFWWDNEHWKVQHQYIKDFRFYICFINDPQSRFIIDIEKHKSAL